MNWFNHLSQDVHAGLCRGASSPPLSPGIGVGEGVAACQQDSRADAAQRGPYMWAVRNTFVLCGAARSSDSCFVSPEKQLRNSGAGLNERQWASRLAQRSRALCPLLGMQVLPADTGRQAREMVRCQTQSDSYCVQCKSIPLQRNKEDTGGQLCVCFLTLMKPGHSTTGNSTLGLPLHSSSV